MYTNRLVLFLLLISLTNVSKAQSWSWAKSGTVTHTTESSFGSGVSADQSGNLYAVGYYGSPTLALASITLSNNGANGDDFFIVKYDVNGSISWAKSFGGTGNDEAYGVSTDIYGNVYITGTFDSHTITLGTSTFTNAGGQDLFLMKLDKNGIVIWARTYGGSGSDVSNFVGTDSHGKPFITGQFASHFLHFGSTILVDTTSQTQPFVVRLDTAGNILWALTAKGTGGGNGNFGAAACTDTASNLFVAGGFAFSILHIGTDSVLNNGVTNMFLAKFDSVGNVIWIRAAGGANEDAATGIGADRYGNVFVCGSFNSPSITFGTSSLANEGSSDIFIAKYGPDGSSKWAAGTGGTGIDQAKSIGVDQNGYAYLCGSFGSPSIDFGNGSLVDNGSLNLFLAEYSPIGIPLWSKSSGGSASDYALSAYTDASGNGYIAGYFNSSSVSFGGTTLVATGISNMLVAKIAGITGIELFSTAMSEINAYPNPVEDLLNFRFKDPKNASGFIVLFNSLGQEMKRIAFSGATSTSIAVDDLSNGVYFYSVLDSQKRTIARGKVIKL